MCVHECVGHSPCSVTPPSSPFLPTEIALALTYVRVQISPCPLPKACTSSPNLFLLLETAPAAPHLAAMPRPLPTRSSTRPHPHNRLHPHRAARQPTAWAARVVTVMSIGPTSTHPLAWADLAWMSTTVLLSSESAFLRAGPHDKPRPHLNSPHTWPRSIITFTRSLDLFWWIVALQALSGHSQCKQTGGLFSIYLLFALFFKECQMYMLLWLMGVREGKGGRG